MKVTLLIAAMAIGYVHAALAQVVTVRDVDTKDPVEMALISDSQGRRGVTTNAHGEADLGAFAPADTLLFRFIGYKTHKTTKDRLEQIGYTVFLEQSAITMDQVVISATKWKQPNRDVPSKVAVISRSDVQLQNPQTAADLLGSSGEVFIQKSQLGGGSPMIRGFSTNRLLIAVDGIRMNTAIFRSGNLQNVILLDPLAIEHTEVLFGPGSVIYGSDAIGGVMSFQTMDPEYALSDKTFVSGNALGRYASASDELTGHFDLKLGWRKWALVTSVSYTDYGDLKMGSNGPAEYLRPWYVERIGGIDSIVTNADPELQVPTGYSQFNVMQKVGFKPSESWELNYAFHYSNSTDVPRYDRLIEERNGLPRSAEWRYGPQKWMMHNLTVLNSSESKFYDNLALRLAFQQFQESRIDRSFRSAIRRRRVENVDAYSLNADFTKRISNRQHLNYGAEVVHNVVDSRGTFENIETSEAGGTSARYPDSRWTSMGLYATYQYEFSENLLASAGLRYSHFFIDSEFDTTYFPYPFTTAELNDGALTGSIGLVWHPDPSWTLSANVSTGFRAPNVDDIGKVFDSEPGNVIVPNPNLQSEYAYNFEVGLAKIIGERFKVDLAAYYTILDNALVRRPYMLNGQDSIIYDGELSRVQAIQNAATATVYGIQAGVEVKLPAGFGASAVFNAQRGEEELDDGSTSPSRHAAPAFGSLHITYRKGRVSLDLYTLYSAERAFDELPQEERAKEHLYAMDENGNPYSPSWFTLNLKGRFKINDMLAASVGIENILDKRYRPYSSGIAGPGLNGIAALQFVF